MLGMLALISALLNPGAPISLGLLQYGQVNLAYVPGGFSAPDDYPPSPCVMNVIVFDGRGNAVKNQTISLTPGQTGVLKFTRSDLASGGSLGIFTEQGQVENTCDPSNDSCDFTLCNITQSVEIVDTLTGVTRALDTPSINAPDFDQE
ncbi:MAG TPA: hypothetical protein VMA09_05085 [Candidatus Binataceae bacterium]|nr:hypothetical protein [Candidatus Binataceae bacterium]